MMDHNSSKMERVELAKQLNENLLLISNNELQLKEIKKRNKELETQVTIENQNYTNFSNDYKKYCDKLEEVKRLNQDLINKSKQLDENIQEITKKINEDN